MAQEKNLSKAFEKESADDPKLALKNDMKEKLKKLQDWEEAAGDEESGSEASLDKMLTESLAKQKRKVTDMEKQSDAEGSSDGEEEEDEEDEENETQCEDGDEDDEMDDEEADEDFEMEESEEEGEESETEDDEEEEEDIEEEEEGGKTKPPHQLVLVAKDNEKSTQLVRNSVTHKTEWDCFNRAIANKKLFPIELSQYVVKSKNDLFGAWLDAKRDWGQCKLIIQRRHSNRSESMSGWIAVTGKKLVEEYGQTKADVLMEKRLAAGLYYNHEDFPEDRLERSYYMKKAKEITRAQAVEDSTDVRGEMELDSEALGTLINEEDGIMRAGAIPDFAAANAQGQKALMDGLYEEGSQKAPKKRTPRETDQQEGAKEVKPKTLLEQAADLMADLLAESTNARKKSMSLGGAAFSGELASQLLNHATTMEKHYKTLQTAVNNKCDSEEFFTKAFAKIQKDRAWFVSAEAAADAILNGLRKASKPKQKARAKPKAKDKR